jgi:hypothetical protein
MIVRGVGYGGWQGLTILESWAAGLEGYSLPVAFRLRRPDENQRLLARNVVVLHYYSTGPCSTVLVQ